MGRLVLDEPAPHRQYAPFRYKYVPLDQSKNSIRLLHFQDQSSYTTPVEKRSSKRAEPVQCVLETYDLDQCIPYVALSYAWGQPQSKHHVLVNKKLMPVGENLHSAMHVLRQKSQVHFTVDPEREAELIQHHFWIDAICINQDDDDERSHQVNLMARIFSEAKCVIAWLGPKSFDSSLGIRALATEQIGHRTDDVRDVHMSHSDQERVLRDHYMAKEDAQSAVIDLLNRSYWGRMWVVQEFLLPKSLMILCGHNGVWWERMEQNFLSKSREDLALFWSRDSLMSDHRETSWWNLSEARQRWQASIGQEIREPHTLDQLLSQFHRQKSRDVRDRVYALLSLVKMPAAATSRVLSVDYTIPPSRLYHRVLGHLRQSNTSLRNFVEWSKFRLLLSHALEVPQDAKFQRHDSLYEITDILQDDILLQLNVAEQVAVGLVQGIHRYLSPLCTNTEEVVARLRLTFPREEDPDSWRVFEQASGVIESCLTKPATAAHESAALLDILVREEKRLVKSSRNSHVEGDIEFLRTVRAMLEPEEEWLHMP